LHAIRSPLPAALDRRGAPGTAFFIRDWLISKRNRVTANIRLE
jgi:hypothetical protein